jgi:hypothetical protein
MSWVVSGVSRAPALFQIAGTPSAAYSLRQLDLVDKNVVRVRRSSDNTEQDFTATQVTDGTLTTFCGAGDGFVRTWYDQSGNGLDLAQTVAENQPQLVNSGAVITQNSKPTISHAASARWLFKDTSYTTANHTTFQVGNITSSAVGRMLTIVSEQAVLRAGAITNQAQIYGAGLAAAVAIANGWPRNTQSIHTAIFAHTDGDGFAWRNGSLIHSNTTGAGATASVSSLYVGGVSGGSEGFTGNAQEIIIYRSNQSADRAAIEAYINAHYAIY